MSNSRLESKFIKLWTQVNPDLTLNQECYLIPGRKYRFDFVHYPSKIAIEINGGTYATTRYGHSSGQGINRDYKKNNLAQLKGFYVFCLDSKMIDKTWIELIGKRIRYLTFLYSGPN